MAPANFPDHSRAVMTSPWRGKILSMRTRCASGSGSRQRSLMTVRLKSMSAAWCIVERTAPLVATPPRTRVSTPRLRSTVSKSLPEKADTRRLVTTMSPSAGATSREILTAASPSTKSPCEASGARSRLLLDNSGWPGRKLVLTWMILQIEQDQCAFPHYSTLKSDASVAR